MPSSRSRARVARLFRPLRLMPDHRGGKRRASAATETGPSSHADAVAAAVPIWIVVGLVLLNVFVYAAVVQHQLVNWDDPDYVSQNRHVAAGLSAAAVRWAFTTGHSANWHPLTWLSHMLDATLFGANAGGYHVTSVLLHLASTLLLFAVLRAATGALWRSGVVAALFAVHPAHVESVAWIAERKDVLSAFFFMLALHAYVRHTRTPRLGSYVALVGWFALGLLSKPMVVTLPFVLLLLDVWPLRRRETRSWPALVREKLPLFALALASSIVTFVVQSRGDAVYGLDERPLGARVAEALGAYVTYLRVLVWPARLAVVYPYPPAASLWRLALIAVLLAGITSIAVRYRKSRPYMLMGWLWYLGMLVPVIGLVPIGSQATADRYTYLPFIGLFILVVWAGADVIANWAGGRSVLVAASVIAIGGCAVTARLQVQHWADSETLWRHALAVTEGNWRAHSNLGNALSESGRVPEAIVEYNEALALRPSFAEAHNNLANALASQGRRADAIGHYREAVRLRPADPLAHNGLGSVLEDAGRLDEAIAQYKEALRLDPDFAEAHNNLGAVLGRQGRLDEAAAEMRLALQLRPANPDIHYNLALMLRRQGREEDAVSHLHEALRLDPDHTAARDQLKALRSAPRPRP
jgi:Flp pilus assembly protein TadD